MYRVGKTFKFEAAHQLPGHKGKCANLHGHSYTVEVSFSSKYLIATGSSEGMVYDFSDISEVIKSEIISNLDHKFLNDILPFRTTAENLAHYIWWQIHGYSWQEKGLSVPGPWVESVAVWETDTSWAEYSGE